MPDREPVDVLLLLEDVVGVLLADDDGKADPEDDGDRDALGLLVGMGVVVVVLD